MHGLGNDFVIIDARRLPFAVTAAKAAAIADRHRGVGCDQFIVMEPARQPGTDAYVRFWNPDGSEAGACGNGSRCVAALLTEESGRNQITLETLAGLLPAGRTDSGMSVDLGPAHLEWQAVPLSRPCDTLHLPLTQGELRDPAALSLGNPHATFFVADAEAVPLTTLGPMLEQDPLFPQKANIGVASLCGPDQLRVRVWERAAGLTQACGTGASAAAVNAARRGLTGRKVRLDLDGGSLTVEWRADNHVIMSGAVATSFVGQLSEALS